MNVHVSHVLMHFGFQLCSFLLPTCQTRSYSFKTLYSCSCLSSRNIRTHAQAHMHAACMRTQSSHLHSAHSLTLKIKMTIRSHNFWIEAFKNADEPQRTLHLVSERSRVKARDLICTEVYPTAGQSKLYKTHTRTQQSQKFRQRKKQWQAFWL